MSVTLPQATLHKGTPLHQVWLLYQILSLLKIVKKVFFVRSMEQLPCPCCSGVLKVIGSRKRKSVSDSGNIKILVVRRLRCIVCNRIHHELPDILVPYKRYDRKSIEAVLDSKQPLTVAVDECTIIRWRTWFRKMSNYFLGCLISLNIRYGNKSVAVQSTLPKSMLQRIRHYVGDAPRWLARVVRSLANTNLWVHTRSAFMS